MDFFTLENIILNSGYLFMLGALIVKDMFRLRLILLFAYLFLIYYSLNISSYFVTFWNTLFFVINFINFFRLVKEKVLLKVPNDLKGIYKDVFSSMAKSEFLYFWNTGHEEVYEKDALILEKDSKTDSLYLILEGTAGVFSESDTKIAVLSSGQFIAEMSFLTKNPVSADVSAEEELALIEWSQNKINMLKKLKPSLFIKIQNILANDLAHKIRN